MARAARTVRPQKIGVIGAGIGGLVAAYELAEAGHEVTLFEQHGVTGGKIHQDLALNRPIDSGPTVMTMRWVFDDLLAKSGRSLDDLVELAPLEVLARHHWPDGACLDLYTDLERSAQAIGEFAGLQESRAFRAFMDQARAVYHRLEPIYMRGSKPGFWDMTRQLGPTGLALLTRLGPLQSLAQHLGRRFKDPRLQQLFGRYATYCGGSPWQAPATLMLIAYVEMRGVWAMTGGMQALAQALTDAFQALGGRLVLKTRVDQILQKDGRLCGLVASSDDGAGAGEPVDLDAVIFNGDIRGLRTSVPHCFLSAQLLRRIFGHIRSRKHAQPAHGLPLRPRSSGRTRRSPSVR
jgi:1-hydroxycarotenoid 3,4-desaturase